MRVLPSPVGRRRPARAAWASSSSRDPRALRSRPSGPTREPSASTRGTGAIIVSRRCAATSVGVTSQPSRRAIRSSAIASAPADGEAPRGVGVERALQRAVEQERHRGAPRHQLAQHRAQAPHIGARLERGARPQLGGGVGRFGDRRDPRAGGAARERRAEIDHHGVAGDREHQVVGRDVAMDQPGGVDRLEAAGDVARDRDRDRQRDRAPGGRRAAEQRPDGPAAHQLHHQPVAAILLEQRVGVRDVRVDHRAAGPGLGEERAHVLGGLEGGRGQGLERDRRREALGPDAGRGPDLRGRAARQQFLEEMIAYRQHRELTCPGVIRGFASEGPTVAVAIPAGFVGRVGAAPLQLGWCAPARAPTFARRSEVRRRTK